MEALDNFIDTKLKRDIEKGENFEVDKQRGEYLISQKVAKIKRVLNKKGNG